MACGRPAYVYDVFGGDGWVTAETYDAIEADAIAGQAFPGVIDADRLRNDLDAYDPAMGHVNRHADPQAPPAPGPTSTQLVRVCPARSPPAARDAPADRGPGAGPPGPAAVAGR